MVPDLTDCFQGKALKADPDLQEGRYKDARKGYEGVIQDNRTWDNLVRLAYLKAKMGDVDGAEQLYIEAEDDITAKEMRFYAWVELQRGLLDLSHGSYEGAWSHYKRANEAYSGYWLTDEHIAELLGAQGKFDEAVVLYEEVIARVPRPELQQTLGDLYVFMGKNDQAQPWHEKALAAYLKSAQRGAIPCHGWDLRRSREYLSAGKKVERMPALHFTIHIDSPSETVFVLIADLPVRPVAAPLQGV